MVELGYNEVGLSDISFITLYTQWYQLILHKFYNVTVIHNNYFTML
jgi:hypothetical protein